MKRSTSTHGSTRTGRLPRRGTAMAAAFATMVGMAGCAGEIGGGSGDDEGGATGEGGEQETRALDMASVYDAEAPQSQAAVEFGSLLEECTDGALTVNFYPNGSLGTENDNFDQVSSGELDMTLAGAVGPNMFAPEYMFYQAPFMMQDQEHVQAFIDSELHDEFVGAMDEHNVHLLSHIHRGVRHSTSNQAFTTPDELAGTAFRLPEIPVWVTIWSQLGIEATPVALPELYSALQTGVVGASEGPYEQFATFSLNEVQDYVVNTGHVVEVVQFWIGLELYESLPQDQRDCVDQASAEAAEIGTQMVAEANDQFLQELKDGGMEVIEPDREAFVEAAREPLEQLFEDEWTVTTYDEVMSLAD
ncbi:TRAP transporter substrate-binding protein [Ornithinicoccus halotolerans]|uniref:TRAP transporter substrate-binding protein n=1 Tax=Ornithinicoccus halotolerans TaxID=1748220 RepID=UPI001297F792|nr:TRAP transporter substrate-binding protein [Ornithinicoccus halotolerans]